LEITWTPGKHYLQSRSVVCGKVDEGVERDVGDQNKVVNSIPSADRWTDRVYQSGTGTIP